MLGAVEQLGVDVDTRGEFLPVDTAALGGWKVAALGYSGAGAHDALTLRFSLPMRLSSITQARQRLPPSARYDVLSASYG